jgi:S-adenosyl-L-methionine hydrolase (adenosine-forming)
MRRVVTLTTDFGTADGYVGEMKGVILTLAPNAELVDITHDIPPQDVDYARLTVARVWRRFPAGTVHVVVVDPGVGGARAALAVAANERFLIGPDNGVLSPALLLADARAVVLPVPKIASATFHGRDVFAPAAARLARGDAVDSLGPAAAAPIIRRTPEPVRAPDGSLLGEVIVVDRFGNAITNLIGLRGGSVEVAGRSIAIRRTYADVARGELVAVAGSTGFLEIAVRDGDASTILGLRRGIRVTLRHQEDSFETSSAVG